MCLHAVLLWLLLLLPGCGLHSGCSTVWSILMHRVLLLIAGCKHSNEEWESYM
jgi:hypothetical protein